MHFLTDLNISTYNIPCAIFLSFSNIVQKRLLVGHHLLSFYFSSADSCDRKLTKHAQGSYLFLSLTCERFVDELSLMNNILLISNLQVLIYFTSLSPILTFSFIGLSPPREVYTFQTRSFTAMHFHFIRCI